MTRHIHEFDLLAHLQHKDLSAAREAGRLEDQQDRFRNRHEVPCDFRMGDSDRAALLDLLQKQRHHAAVTAQDIAEADGREYRATVTVAMG